MKRTILVSVSIVLILLFASLSAPMAESEPFIDSDQIFLYTGSPLLLHENQVVPLDSNNPEVAATVVDNRTLLPLRAISEYFGATVEYDEALRQAIINYNGVQYFFPVNQKQYMIKNGESTRKVSMDTQSLILNDRIMVPVRVISEEILGLSVSYYNRVIAIGDQALNLKVNTALFNDVKSKIGSAVKPRTLAELKYAFDNSRMGLYTAMDQTKNIAEPSTAVESADAPLYAGEMPSAGSTATDSSYSKTNTQVEGIDEADIVKTDGKYIYIVANNGVRIVKADQGSLTDIGALKLDQNKYVNDLYVSDGRLILIGTRYEYEATPYPVDGVRIMEVAPDVKAESIAADDKMSVMPYPMGKNYTYVDVYDLADPSNPKFVKSHEMEGSYQTSRKNGDIVYLISNTYLYNNIILPMVKDTATGSEAKELDLKDVMILPDYPANGYVAVSAIDVTNGEKAEVEAIAAPSFVIYMNDQSLYLATYDYNGNTLLNKFDINGLSIGYAGSGTVTGSLLNQFSMDEYNGNLRVATTTWEKGSGLYVLDDSLNVIGSVTGLAKGETIYSVRFFGEKGYIVTFRTMDPLFVFDLSDPTNPKLTGELKIPGFSNYLHPIGEDLLLGIGADTTEIYQKDANGNEVVIGTRQGGIKLSLFDVSDMGKPKEISNYVAGYSGSYTEAFYNHKAILIDLDEKLVGFDADVTTDVKGTTYQQGALLMSFAGNDLSLKAQLKAEPISMYGQFTPYARRIITIGDYLYYIRDGRIASYDYITLKSVDSLALQ